MMKVVFESMEWIIIYLLLITAIIILPLGIIDRLISINLGRVQVTSFSFGLIEVALRSYQYQFSIVKAVNKCGASWGLYNSTLPLAAVGKSSSSLYPQWPLGFRQ
jgi:hypothetical protein